MILLVEDDDSIRSAMSELLSSEGYEIVQAANGKEALEALHLMNSGEAPCLILLDLMMPVMDGREFLDEIQKDDKLRSKRIPIVITSAMAGQEATIPLPFVAKKIMKPFNVDDVLETIEEYCG